jgi:predicted HD phosphohydrolase
MKSFCLYGKLHILHVAVMVLQTGADIDKLIVRLGHDLGQLNDGLGRTHAGDHVLAWAFKRNSPISFFSPVADLW